LALKYLLLFHFEKLLIVPKLRGVQKPDTLLLNSKINYLLGRCWLIVNCYPQMFLIAVNMKNVFRTRRSIRRTSTNVYNTFEPTMYCQGLAPTYSHHWWRVSLWSVLGISLLLLTLERSIYIMVVCWNILNSSFNYSGVSETTNVFIKYAHTYIHTIQIYVFK